MPPGVRLDVDVTDMDGVLLPVGLTVGRGEELGAKLHVGWVATLGTVGSAVTSPDPSAQNMRNRWAVLRPVAGMGARTRPPAPGVQQVASVLAQVLLAVSTMPEPNDVTVLNIHPVTPDTVWREATSAAEPSV